MESEMTNLDTCIEKAENALRQLELAKKNPADEMALIFAYGDLQSAMWYCRFSCRDHGFDPVDIDAAREQEKLCG